MAPRRTLSHRIFRPRRFQILAALISAIVMLFVAACSSSGDSSSASSAPGSTSPDATSPGSGGSSGSGGVAAAQAEYDKYKQEPTDVGITTPLPKPASTVAKKSIIYMQNATPEGEQIANGIQKAASLLGWNYKAIQYQTSTTAAIQTAFNQAIAEHPNAIFDAGTPDVVLTRQRAEMAQAGIKFIECCESYPDDASNPPIAVVNAKAQINFEGQLLADGIIAKTNGKVHALTVVVPTFSILKGVADGVKARFAELCASTCKSTELNVTLGNIGTQLPNMVTSALQRDPSINYLAFTCGCLGVGVPQALRQAGLTSKVKLASHDAQANTLADLKSGTQEFGIADSNTVTGFRQVDAYLRYLQGVKFPMQVASCDEQGPTACTHLTILEKGKDYGSDVELPANYEALFKQLWQL
jgi:hypothetical protein